MADFVDFGLQIGKNQDWGPYTNWVEENDRKGTWEVIEGGIPDDAVPDFERRK